MDTYEVKCNKSVIYVLGMKKKYPYLLINISAAISPSLFLLSFDLPNTIDQLITIKHRNTFDQLITKHLNTNDQLITIRPSKYN